MDTVIKHGCVSLAVVITVFTGISFGYRLVCYYDEEGAHRAGRLTFTPADIDQDMCTHLVYVSRQLLNTVNGETRLDFTGTTNSMDGQMYKVFNELKYKSTEMKTLLCLGEFGYKAILPRRITSRSSIVQEIIRFLRIHEFDGLDIDFQGYTDEMGKTVEMQDMIDLLKAIKQGFQEEKLTDFKQRLLLSSTTRLTDGMEERTDVTGIAEIVDFINIVMEDYHNEQTDTKRTNDLRFRKVTASENSNRRFSGATFWDNLRTLKTKINIGISLSGKRFGAIDHGAINDTPDTDTKLSYYEICSLIETTEGKVYFDEEKLVPYFVRGASWISFEDSLSVIIKVNWLKQQGFGGAMVSSLDRDDFNRFCISSPRRFPLTRSINDTLKDGSLEAPCIKDALCLDYNTECLIKESYPIQSTCKCASGFSNIYGECKQDGRLFAQCLPEQVCSDYTMECVPSTSKFSNAPYCDCKKGFTEKDGVCNKNEDNLDLPYEDADATSVKDVFQTKEFCDDKQCGLYGDPRDCSKYYVCGAFNGQIHKSCPSGLWFNINENMCDLPGSSNFKCI